MSTIDISAFYSKNHLPQLNRFPKGSSDWIVILDQISTNIKNFDDFIAGLTNLPNEFNTTQFNYILIDQNDKQRIILEGELRPIIELPLERRLIVYEDFPNIIKTLNSILSYEDTKSNYTNKQSLLELLKTSILNTKNNISEISNLDEILNRLNNLKDSRPSDEQGFRLKMEWLKEVTSALSSLNFIDPILKSIQKEIPKFWNQLTFKQKLQVSAIAPIIGAGAVIGSVGVAGMGNAVGVPLIIVIIILLFLTNGIIDFLDFIIDFLTNKKKESFDYQTAKETFNTIFENALADIFKSNISFEKVSSANTFQESNDKARDYEFHTVSQIAQEMNGEGFVTSQSKDFGIDGYVINKINKEVIIIQSKYYSNKVGFGDATKYLGTLKYWQKRFSRNFEYPIIKIIVCCPLSFSIEAKELAKLFPDEIELRSIKY